MPIFLTRLNKTHKTETEQILVHWQRRRNDAPGSEFCSSSSYKAFSKHILIEISSM